MIMQQVALQAHPTWVVCKADFRNAFNECSRLAFLTFVAAHFPLLALALLMAAYGAPAYVMALGPQGWVRFLSRRRCMQGCPAGPLCFAAALQRLLVQARLDHPQCFCFVRGGFAPPCRKSKRPMYQGPPGRVSASKYARPYRRVTATVSSFCRLVVFYCWGFTV